MAAGCVERVSTSSMDVNHLVGGAHGGHMGGPGHTCPIPTGELTIDSVYFSRCTLSLSPTEAHEWRPLC